MRQKIIKIGGLAAALLLVLTSSGFAELRFENPVIGGIQQSFIESGATATVRIIYRRPDAAFTQLSAAQIFFTYDPAIVDQDSINIANNGSPLVMPMSDTSTAGRVRIQLGLDTGSANPQPLNLSDDTPLVTVRFHVRQGITAGNPNLAWDADQNNVNVSIVGNPVQSGGTNLTDITIDPGTAPNFVGVNFLRNGSLTDSDNRIGNTVNLDWRTNGAAGIDLAAGANAQTPYTTGTLSYRLYRATNLELNLNRIELQRTEPNHSTTNDPALHTPYLGNAGNYLYADGPGTGVPAANNALNDGTAYWYQVNAIDDTSPTPNERTTPVLSVTPTDTTPPDPVTDFAAGTGNTQLNLTWANPANADLGGVIIIRRDDGNPVGEVALIGADGANFAHGQLVTEGDTLGGGRVIFAGNLIDNRGSSASQRNRGGAAVLNTFQDTGLTNGTLYNYRIIPYDQIEGDISTGNLVQMGRNYNVTVVAAAGTPGVAPGAVADFYSISSPEAGQITLHWTNPAQEFFGGVVFLSSTDSARRWNAIPDNPEQWINTVQNNNQVQIIRVYSPETPASVLNRPQSIVLSSGLNLSRTYFFKAFSYNATGTPLDVQAQNNINSHRWSAAVAAAALPAPASGTRVETREVVTTREGAAVAREVAVAIRKRAGSFGVNFLGVPFDPPMTLDGTEINTLGDLVVRINQVGGGGAVSAIAYWEEGEQRLLGGIYNSDGRLIYNTAGYDEGISLRAGKGFHVSVTKDVSFRLRK